MWAPSLWWLTSARLLRPPSGDCSDNSRLLLWPAENSGALPFRVVAESLIFMRTVFNNALPFDFDGLSIRELTPASLQTASIATIDVPVGARHRTARSSRSDKVYVCLEGLVSFVVQDREVSLGTLDVLHVATSEWFSYSNESGKPARLLLVHVPPFSLASEEFLVLQDDSG